MFLPHMLTAYPSISEVFDGIAKFPTAHRSYHQVLTKIK
jgi:hypothetical protein